MHTFLIPLVGVPLAIGFFYLYKDLRKVKNWNIARDRLAQPRADALEVLAYSMPPTDNTAVEAFGTGLEAGIEASVEAASEGTGHLLESMGHFLHH